MGRVTLTFDNGPHPVGTPRVLDALAARGLTATFFAVGRRLAAPGGLALARSVVAAGHRLGSHTWSHTPLGHSPDPEATVLELARTKALVDQVWDGEPLFRPVGGGSLGPHLLNEAALRWLTERRFTCVIWNSVPGDWLDPEGWVERALDDAAALPHQLVVLHDACPEGMEQLGRYLDAVTDAGHTFCDAFPEACLPLVRGRARPGLRDLVSATRHGGTDEGHTTDPRLDP